MDPPDVASSQTRPFLETRGELAGSLLYLDAGAAEVVQINLGLKAILEFQVVHVCELQRAGPLDLEVCRLLSPQADPTKILILTTQLLTDTHSAVLRVLQAHPQARSCVVWCSVSEDAHASQPTTTLGEDAYLEYENALNEDLAEMRGKAAAGPPAISISVRFFPLHACALTNDLFVLPSASSAVRMARLGDKPAGFGMSGKQEEGSDNASASGFKLLAHSLVGLAANMEMRLETFSLGTASNLLGEEVCSLVPPEGPGGRAPRGTAALVLVDRSLDLVTPCSHGEHLVDRIFGILPHRSDPAPGATAPPVQDRSECRPVDVPVPWLERGEGEADDRAAGGSGESEAWSQDLKSGSLFPMSSNTDKSQASQWLNVLLGQRERDATLYLRRWLKEALRKEGLQPKARFKAGSVSPAEIVSLTEVLADNPTAALHQRAVLFLAFAVVAALTGPTAGKWDALSKQEKQLTLISSEGADAVMNELLEVANVAADFRRLDVDGVLQLMILGYSHAAEAALAGLDSFVAPFTPEQERELRDALVQAILQADLQEGTCSWLGELRERIVQLQSDSSPTSSPARQEDAAYNAKALRLELQDKVDEIIRCLRDISRSRQKLPVQLKVSSEQLGEAPVPLIQSLISAIAGGESCPDFQHHTASLRGLLNSGLGRFGIKHKEPKPSDYDTVIVFVVGGISTADARAARTALQGAAPLHQKRPQFLVGGTSLLTPTDVLQCVF